MRHATKRRARRFLQIVLIGALIGIAYGAITGVVFKLIPLARAVVGAIDGAAISAPIAAIEIFLVRSRLGRRLRQAPFLVTFGVKWVVYGAVIIAVVVGGPGAGVISLVLHDAPLLHNAPLQHSLLRLGLVFSVVATVVFLLVLELGQIVGLRNLRDVVLGRYHRPRVEERFFLFVDIAGSTSLAERLGPTAVHHFLAELFRLASDPIDDNDGEIYQYVGDEMVVTWTASEGRRDARPIACFFAIVAALREATAMFERDFGATPRLRAALHAGTVISGEIGETKRGIVFHGDVMNTASRLEQATRDLDRPFLVSAQALHLLGRLDGYDLESLGPQALRGRAAPVDVSAVRERTAPATRTAIQSRAATLHENG